MNIDKLQMIVTACVILYLPILFLSSIHAYEIAICCNCANVLLFFSAIWIFNIQLHISRVRHSNTILVQR